MLKCPNCKIELIKKILNKVVYSNDGYDNYKSFQIKIGKYHSLYSTKPINSKHYLLVCSKCTYCIDSQLINRKNI